MAERPQQACEGAVTVVECDDERTPQVFEDPHIEAINAVQSIEHPVAGQVKLVAPAVQFSYASNKVRSPPPTLGQHTEDVLLNILGYSSDKILELKKLGAIA